MNDGNLKAGERLFLTVVIVGFMLVAYCAEPVDPGLPMETYDRDIIGGR